MSKGVDMNLLTNIRSKGTATGLIIFFAGILALGGLAYLAYQVSDRYVAPRVSSVLMPMEKVKKIVLKNGMHVLAFKNPSSPKVLVQIAYDIGSGVEGDGERGLAHLLEHLIFKGTERLSETDIGAIAKKYGAKFNAFTGPDITSYFFETNKNNWRPFVGLLAECMQHARFHNDFIASEIKAIIQELRMHRDNYLRLLTQKAAELVFPPNHPYHDPVIGYKEDLVSISSDSVKNFYDKYYRPDRATLFIVGDIDIDEALDVAQKTFESIPVLEKSVTKDLSFHTPELVVHQTRIFQDVKRQKIAFYWAIPGIMDEGELVSSALEFLLGTGKLSRLHQVLIEKKKLASRIQVKNFKLMHGGIFFIFIDPIIGKAEKCRSVVKKIIKDVIDNGFENEELTRMANGKVRSFLENMSSNKYFTYRWIKSYLGTKDEFEIFKRLNRYKEITSEQIQLFAKKYLDPFLINQIDLDPVPESKKGIIKTSREHWDAIEKQILSAHHRTSPLEEPRVAPTMKDPEPLDFSFPQPDKVFDLKNGLRIILKSQKNWPLVCIKCRLKEAEYFSRSSDGVAVGIMMKMLMEGTSKSTKQELINFFEHHGASYSLNASGISCTCLKDDCYRIIEQLFDVLTNPSLPKERLDRVKQRKLDYFHRLNDSQRFLAKRELLNIIYKGSQFAWTIDDIVQKITPITRADIIKLHQKYVSPANMIISIIGDFDVNDMEKSVRSLFETWAEEGSYLKPELELVTFDPDKKTDISSMRNQAILMLGRPSPLSIQDEALVPVRMLNSILFNSWGSRLYKIREQTGLFYSASGKFAAKVENFPGYDYIRMMVKPEQLGLAEQKIREVVTEVATKGVNNEELLASRQKYLKKLIDLAASPRRVAKMFCRLNGFGVGFDYYDNILDRVQNLTLDEVNDAAAKYLSADGMARVRVGRLEK